MSGRVIAIGDVHGCVAALRSVIEAIQPQPEDTIIQLGDCVDRGPQSCQVIDYLLELRERCHFFPILGNHEELMLNYLDGIPQPDDWIEVGGNTTVESYRDKNGKLQPVPAKHIDFIRTWGDCFETDSHFFVHGAYEPSTPLAHQHWQTMRWHSLKHGVPDVHVSGKTAIVGHTSQKSGKILDLGHIVCIDTFCWGGGWLTALDVTTGAIWQSDRDGKLKK